MQQELLLQFRVGHHLRRGRVQPVDDFRRRLGRREQPIPRRQVIAFDATFGDGRQLRMRRRALPGRDGDGNDLAGVDHWLDRRGRAKGELGVAGGHGLRRRCAAFEGNVCHLHAGQPGELDAGQVRDHAVARGRIVECARMCLGFRYQIGHASDAGLLVDRQNHRRGHQPGNRHEVAGLVFDVLVEHLIAAHQAGSRDIERIAIRRRLRHEFRGDGGASTGPVIDDHRLPQFLAQRVAVQARRVVRPAAGGKTDHQPDRLGGVIGWGGMG
ncbi:hypothetical protein D9M69_404820 [compost metagenome]